MKNLYTYICAIGEKSAKLSLLSEDAKLHEYIDDGILITNLEKTYYFDNGVVLKYQCETDNILSEDVCQECWINYEILDANGIDISPMQKNFYNSCQEAFWLKVQSQYALEGL